MKNILTLLSILVATISFAQTGLRITEISYNPPESGADTTEYIEIYNPTAAPINVNGYSFTQGVVYTFPNVSVPAGGYFVVAVDSVAMQNRFGITAYEWTSGGLSNSGEDIVLVDASNNVVDSVDFEDNTLGWPVEADGGGPSLVLCDLNADQNLGSSWDTSSTILSGVIINGNQVYGSPGAIDASCSSTPLSGLVITEIMYNLPGTDSVEFIEMQNIGSTPLDVTGFYFTQGVVDTFPSISINPGAYLVYTNDSVEFFNKYGFSAYEWNSGGLTNGGEDITIKNASGITVDSVDYDDGAPWPTDADGNGWSLSLSDSSLDNNVGTNWCLSGTLVPGYTPSGTQVYASPGASDTCYMAPVVTNVPTYLIADINNVDANGVADSLNVYCWTKGVVLGVNMRPSGLQFTIWDNGGIGIFNLSGNLGYTVNEGDSVLVRGTVDQFNGLTQMSPDSIQFLNGGNVIPTPTVVTTLDETTESELVRFENALITGISGSNYTLVSGMDTITMRVDSDTDVDDSLTFVIGDSLCYVIGIGGQFDNSSPYTEGYQLFPRYYTDVDTTCGGFVAPPPVPTYPIADINNVDANGVADSLNLYCWTKGVVMGVNMRPAGLQFTIWDNEGIGIFNLTGNLGYTVTEGDSVIVRGTISQFNGLTQINPDSVQFVNSGNPIPTPTVVTTLGENTESELVRFENALVSSISGSNYTLVSGNDTIVMRVDSDTDVDDSLTFVVGDSLCYVIGIGGQFDNSNPYISGYQMFPRYYTDVDTTCGGVINPPAPTINTYDIGLLRTVDANGEVDSLNVYCAVEGIVHGVDLDGNNGLSFFIKDETGGINIFNFNDVDGYVVTEGDEIRAVGEVIMFNGLAELFVDSITILSTDNCIPFPRVVEDLDESTESDYIEIRNVFIAPGQFWPAPTFNENLDIVTESGDTLTMRIDKDTYLPDSILFAPSGVFNIVGIGGQFDANAPYDEGYQIFPMFPYDFDTVPDVVPDGFVINEVGPENDALIADGNGEFDDWIELYNGGSESVDLVGMHVTNDLDAVSTTGDVVRIPRCFNNAPVNLTLAPNDWMLLWMDDEPEQGPDHLELTLDIANIYPAIATADLNSTIDSIRVEDVGTADYTYGRSQDGDTAWVIFETGTPDASNNNGIISNVETVFATEGFAVYPNPVSGSELFFNQVVDITVFNTTGKVVLDAKQVNRIAVDQFNAGVYIIRTANADVVKVVVR